MKKAMVYTRKLENAGLTREQAEAHLEILEEIFDMDLATKSDIQILRTEIQSVRTEVIAIEHKLIVKLGMLVCAAMGGIVTLLKLLN